MSLQDILAGGNMLPGQVRGGATAINSDELSALNKALEAGYGSDVSQLTGGSALRIQSLDKTMFATIQDNKHFRLFNILAKNRATATVDEWTEQDDVGGFLGGTTNTETGSIRLAQGDAQRRVGLVKYLMTRAEVSVVLSVQNNILQAEAWEQSNAAKRLLSDAEYLCFTGDSDVVPTEYDGIDKIIAGLNSVDHVIDMEATSLQNIQPVLNASATIANFKNFGTPTHVFFSNFVQADLDASLDPAYRVPLPNVGEGGLKTGAPVVGIRTSHGDIATVPDVFIPDGDLLTPFELQHPTIATANAANAPQSAAPVAGAGGADSKWGAAHAGDYYYMVCGVNADGQSTGVKSAQVSVAAGQQVTLTITHSAGGTETGYVIYRSRKDGTNDTADFRFMARVARAAGATTVYVDKNRDIPGTTKAFIMDLLPTDRSVSWQQYLPMMKFQLAPVDRPVHPWAQLMFGFLRVTKRRHHVILKNILPASSSWLPFG